MCPECLSSFSPVRLGQTFCTPVCANRQRQRRYRAAHQGSTDRLTHEPLPLRSALRDSGSLSDHRAEISRLRSSYERRLQRAATNHHHELAIAYDRLSEAAVTADRAVFTATALAERVRLLQGESLSLRQRHRQDVSDLQVLAARLVSIATTTTAGAQLGEQVTAVFARHGWTIRRARP